MAITATYNMLRKGRTWVENPCIFIQNNFKGADWSRYLVSLSATAIASNKNTAVTLFVYSPRSGKYHVCDYWVLQQASTDETG